MPGRLRNNLKQYLTRDMGEDKANLDMSIKSLAIFRVVRLQAKH